MKPLDPDFEQRREKFRKQRPTRAIQYVVGYAISYWLIRMDVWWGWFLGAVLTGALLADIVLSISWARRRVS